MKLAIYHNQPSGGARRALLGFARELVQRHEVHIFTLSTADQHLLRDEDVVGGRVDVTNFTPRKPARFGLYLNDLRRRHDLANLEQVNERVAARIDEAAFDAVLVDACRFTQAPFVLRYLQTPAAYYCHEPPRRLYEGRWQPALTPYQRLRHLARLPLERQFAERLRREDHALVRSAVRVLTNSAYSRCRIREIYGVEAVVCPSGVDLPAVEPMATGSYVLSVGALEPHKGFDFLIDAIGLVDGAVRPPLHIVANDGTPYYQARLESRAHAAGVELRIRRRIPDLELHREYATARAFVYGAYDEPLGLAPLEAMAHGRPVIAVGEGGVPETVVHDRTGLLVERDEQAFAAALTRVLALPSLAVQMGSAGREHVREYWSWRERSEALERELAALAGRGQVAAR